MMVHGYHVIMGLYGFWLPNDPRGSWSEFVGAWELLKFGATTRSVNRSTLLTPEQLQRRREAKEHLKYPPVKLTGQQARSIARGFAEFCRKSGLTIWECSILPEHVHLVIARFRYDIEQVATLLKGEATRRLRADAADPMLAYAQPGRSPRSPWARGEWKGYLDSEEAIENAIHYVRENPRKEDKPLQHWSFVKPFAGIETGGCITYL